MYRLLTCCVSTFDLLCIDFWLVVYRLLTYCVSTFDLLCIDFWLVAKRLWSETTQRPDCERDNPLVILREQTKGFLVTNLRQVLYERLEFFPNIPRRFWSNRKCSFLVFSKTVFDQSERTWCRGYKFFTYTNSSFILNYWWLLISRLIVWKLFSFWHYHSLSRAVV